MTMMRTTHMYSTHASEAQASGMNELVLDQERKRELAGDDSKPHPPQLVTCICRECGAEVLVCKVVAEYQVRRGSEFAYCYKCAVELETERWQLIGEGEA